MVNKYANPETVLGFAYRFSQPEPTQQSASGADKLPTLRGAYATVSACN